MSVVTTALDVVGLVAIAVGCGWWIWQEVSPPAGLVAGGIIVALISGVAAAAEERRQDREAAAPAQARDGST